MIGRAGFAGRGFDCRWRWPSRAALGSLCSLGLTLSSAPSLSTGAEWTGKLEAYGNAYFESPGSGLVDPFVGTRITGEKDVFLSDSIVLEAALRLDLAAPNPRSTLLAAPGTRASVESGPILQADRLGVRWEGDVDDVALGRLPLSTSLAELRPVTRIQYGFDATDPYRTVQLDPWQLSARRYFDGVFGGGEAEAILAYLPFSADQFWPDEDSRWRTVVNDPSFAVPTTAVSEGDPRSFGEQDAFVAFLHERSSAFDYVLGAYAGPSAFPIIRQEFAADGTPLLLRDYAPVWRAFGGVSVPFESLIAYAESDLVFSQGGEDDDYLRLAFGSRVPFSNFAADQGWDDLSFTAEYRLDVVLAEQTDPRFVLSSEESRPQQNNLALRMTWSPIIDLRIKLEVDYNLEDSDNLQAAEIDWSLSDSWSLTGYLFFADGEDGTWYGRLRNGDGATLTLTKFL